MKQITAFKVLTICLTAKMAKDVVDCLYTEYQVTSVFVLLFYYSYNSIYILYFLCRCQLLCQVHVLNLLLVVLLGLGPIFMIHGSSSFSLTVKYSVKFLPFVKPCFCCSALSTSFTWSTRSRSETFCTSCKITFFLIRTLLVDQHHT